MSTSNTSIGSPSPDAGAPATSGAGQSAAERSFESDLIELQSVLAVSIVALEYCASDHVGYGGAAGCREFFYTPDGRRRCHRLDWSDVECMLGGAARRVQCSLAQVCDQWEADDAFEYRQAVLRVTEAILGLIRSFDSATCELDRVTVVGFKQVLALCLDDIPRLQADIGRFDSKPRGNLQ